MVLPDRGAVFWLGRLGVLAAGVLHILVVVSILRQPLNVQAAAPAARSVIWPLHNDTVHRPGPAADFFAVYNAGLAVRNGRPLYGLTIEVGVPYSHPFRYLPVLATTLGAAATRFTPRTAWRIWALVNEALLVIFSLMIYTALRVSTRACDSRGSRLAAWSPRLSLGLLFLSTPYFLELHMGQFTFAAMTLAAIGLLALAPGASRPAQFINAFCQSAAALLKVFPLVLLPAFARQRRLWATAALAPAAVVILSWPYFAAHPGDFRMFVTSNFGGTSVGLDSGNFGLVYVISIVLRRLGVVGHWDAFLGVWRISVLGVTALLVLLSRSRDLVLGAVAMFLAHFISYVHVWEHHMSAVIVLGVLLLWRVVDPETAPAARGWVVPTLVVSSLVLLALPTPFVWLDAAKTPFAWVNVAQAPEVWDPLHHSPVWLRGLLASTKALPTAVLYGVALRLLCRGGLALQLPGHSPQNYGVKAS